MLFDITAIYAVLAALIYLVLFMRVSARRGASGVSFGDGGDPVLLRRIRQHGNAAEWITFGLILMIIAEGSGVPAMLLNVSGALLILGRVAHPFGLVPGTAAHPLRYLGNGSNLIAALILMGAIVRVVWLV